MPDTRIEDPPLLRGRARFVDDTHLPGALHAAFVRSPMGHAAIAGIDIRAAEAVPGVHAVWTLDDLRPHLTEDRLVVGLPSPAYRQQRDRPLLADDEVVHVGEAVAMVVADSRYAAEDAAALAEVDYVPLPAVADCRHALAPGSPPVHRDGDHNLLAELVMEFGDVEAAFAGGRVFSASLSVHRGGGHSIEGRGALARLDPVDDLLTLWSSTQTPHAGRNLIARMLGREARGVRVVAPAVGGGFGPKLVTYPEEVAVALAALLLGRPVKWIEDRREHFVASTQERDQFWDIEAAFDADGAIRGVRGTMVHDHGAYTARGANLPYESALTVTLPYDVPGLPSGRARSADQQGAGHPGQGRRASAGGVRHGAAAGYGGGRARDRPRRDPGAQPDRPGTHAVYPSAGEPGRPQGGARQRRLPGLHAGGAGSRRLGRVRGKTPRGGVARAGTRHRARQFRQGHRARPVRIRFRRGRPVGRRHSRLGRGRDGAGHRDHARRHRRRRSRLRPAPSSR